MLRFTDKVALLTGAASGIGRATAERLLPDGAAVFCVDNQTAALQGLPWGTAYGASNAGLLAMTRSMAVDYAAPGVRANCATPGDILTPLATGVDFPKGANFDLLRRISSMTGPKGPEVVAEVIAMLASEDGCPITGECIRVDGGLLA